MTLSMRPVSNFVPDGILGQGGRRGQLVHAGGHGEVAGEGTGADAGARGADGWMLASASAMTSLDSTSRHYHLSRREAPCAVRVSREAPEGERERGMERGREREKMKREKHLVLLECREKLPEACAKTDCF